MLGLSVIVLLVSSLYGRVYHLSVQIMQERIGFLPIWEGVSTITISHQLVTAFPPYMGGCIVAVRGQSPM